MKLKSLLYKLCSLFLALVICVLPACTHHGCAVSSTLDKSNIFRLHIIANSNSDADQAIKLCVRDAVLQYEKVLFDNSEYVIDNAQAAKKILMENASDIYNITDAILCAGGFDYGARLSTGTYDFPDKTYHDVFYPAGEYDALRIVLGDGNGENWWCVMFPTLCIIDVDAGKIEDTEKEKADEHDVEFQSFFGKVYKWFVELFD